MRHYTIGQTLPREIGPMLAEPMPPEWYILRTAPQAELAARSWLLRCGAVDAWFPTEPGWRTVPNARRRKVPCQKRVAPGYLFVCFDRAPLWHVLRERSVGKVAGVVCRGGVPVPIPEAALCQMRQVPGRIAELRAREAAARAVRPGDMAEITAGPLAGWTVEVARIDAGIAHFVLPLLGGQEAEAAVDKLAKVVGL